MSHQHMHRRHQRDSLPLPEEVINALVAPLQERKAEPQQQQQTITSIVYKTMAPTFSGAIAGYTTPGLAAQSVQNPAPSSTPQLQPTTDSSDDVASSSAIEEPKSTARASSSAMPSSLLSPASSVASTVPVVAATSSLRKSSPTVSSPLASSTSSTASPDSTASGDMTSGAKAGIAIGVILVVGAVASLIFFCIRQRKKKAENQRLEDEKHSSSSDLFAANRQVIPDSQSARTMSTAPRLSLRPVTQFLPGFAGDSNRRTSRGNMLNSGAPAAESQMSGAVQMTPQRSSPQSAWERPMTGDSNRANPFGNHAEAVDPVNAAGPPIVQVTDANGETSAASTIAGGAAAGAAAGVAVGLARGASKRGNGPKPLDFTKSLPDVGGPPSPAGTEFSVNEAPGTPVQTNGAAAIAAAGGPQNSAVHRVQLDFKPSMEDELELRAGQLIRLLHEYDDGWALCIRLDRSQQGVVPRTCLSTRPVKPRPQQGPRGNAPPGMRVPQQQQGRPMSPAMNQGQRSASPAQGRPTTQFPQYSPQGRPASPAGNRPSTAGGPHGPQGRPPMNPDQRARSNSPSPAQTQERRNSPPGQSAARTPYGSPPNGSGSIGRKPVPGQAM